MGRQGMRMMKKSIMFAGTVAAVAVSVAFAEQPNDWENLEVNSINREPARTYAMPLASEEAAFTDAIEPETPYKLSLNGNPTSASVSITSFPSLLRNSPPTIV